LQGKVKKAEIERVPRSTHKDVARYLKEKYKLEVSGVSEVFNSMET